MSQDLAHQTVYDRGWTAYEDGLLTRECPYKKSRYGQDWRAAWFEGWYAARQATTPRADDEDEGNRWQRLAEFEDEMEEYEK